MDVSYKNYFATCFFSLFFFTTLALSQNKDSKNDSSIEGDTTILSHFVHHGLSQTQRDPCLQTTLFFPLGPQLKIGLWGSNVSYEGFNNHIWLKIMFDLKVEFNKDASLVMSYNLNQFYKDRLRNGNTLKLSLDVFDFMVNYENESNWEGTETSSRYVGFGKTYTIFSTFKWNNQIGYTMVEVSSLQNYFDLRSTISSSFSKLDYQAGLTATSNPGQFNGNGDFFAFIGLGFKY